jgi:hypothetical protein
MTKRSSDYVGTFMTNDPKLPQIIANIKRTIKAFNAQRRVNEIEAPEYRTYSWSGTVEVRKRAFIRIRGRLGKDNPNAKLYRVGGPLKRYSAQEIKLEHAQRVDVYVSERYNFVPVK